MSTTRNKAYKVIGKLVPENNSAYCAGLMVALEESCAPTKSERRLLALPISMQDAVMLADIGKLQDFVVDEHGALSQERTPYEISKARRLYGRVPTAPEYYNSMNIFDYETSARFAVASGTAVHVCLQYFATHSEACIEDRVVQFQLWMNRPLTREDLARHTRFNGFTYNELVPIENKPKGILPDAPNCKVFMAGFNNFIRYMKYLVETYGPDMVYVHAGNVVNPGNAFYKMKAPEVYTLHPSKGGCAYLTQLATELRNATGLTIHGCGLG